MNNLQGQYVRVQLTTTGSTASFIDPMTLSPKIWLDAMDIDGDGTGYQDGTDTCGTLPTITTIFEEDFESIGNGNTSTNNYIIHDEP